MLDTPTIRTAPMPDAMRVLLRDYPRDAWEDHPGFARATRNWLGAHQGFRRLAATLTAETEAYLDKARDGELYADRLGRAGHALVVSLHGHHHFEDRSYFPELAAADPRFESGLAILEKDHTMLDGVLHDLTRSANRTIQLIQLDQGQARDEAGCLHEHTQAVEALLDRHLGDEEELAVPIILHHRLRG
ncbi:hemerythrin domain-containing protein [Thetidibacter halocola]|uniref:Hemerythrin domain-containing protein n=1 Tax=Thetidibacter halocola TaxID=2827239 RepID=A0A8J7WET9_9RHOB|nr:hemerythrin domain-containing protein [Thetidibacter halocola]MBS0123879.1 hemerythrin domain-containing protein [Thetidibacter halocola]